MQQSEMLNKLFSKYLAFKSAIVYIAFPAYFLFEIAFIEVTWIGGVAIYLTFMILMIGVILVYHFTTLVLPKWLILSHIIGVFSIALPFSFATLYILIDRLQGSCIKGLTGSFDTLYFSYVTLTTTGYGDLVPVGLCRSVAVIEAILGYICLGLLTAFFFTIFSQSLANSERN